MILSVIHKIDCRCMQIVGINRDEYSTFTLRDERFSKPRIQGDSRSI